MYVCMYVYSNQTYLWSWFPDLLFVQEAEAAELRVLEPHIDTHTKEQKEKLKEMEQKREEHADDVIDRLNPDEIVHAGEEKEEKEEKKEVVEDKEESEWEKLGVEYVYTCS